MIFTSKIFAFSDSIALKKKNILENQKKQRKSWFYKDIKF